jgi:GTP 3',8-cyclase
VALKGFNEDELFPLVDWCAARDMDLTFIEVMPMGDLGNEDRLDQYWSLKDLRARLAERFTLTDLAERTGGPARYVRLEETGQKIGFITPLTHNFCESCNRVRLTCTGELYMCLGQEDMADLRAPLRASPTTPRWRTRSAPPSRASPRATTSTIRARRVSARSAAT